jgi:cysteine desulfurase/selenocysteine lyase
MLDTKTLKQDFPLFTSHPDLVYLDSAATALKPRLVISAEQEYLKQYSANVGRGLYPLAEIATEKFEAVRGKVARFIGAVGPEEIIFTAGTTASINLALGLIAENVQQTDNIVVTEMEHHSNYLPWKELARKNNATFKVVPLTGEGILDLSAFENSIDKHTRVVAFSAVSNVLGTINPVSEMVTIVRNINPEIIILVDAAQAIAHAPIRVSEWGADFVAFSAHKMFGPTGVGVLYGKKTLLETLSPVIFGGGMVLDACRAETLYKDSPYRFESGTPNISGIIALGAAVTYIENIGLQNIRSHEMTLTKYALQRLKEVFGEKINIFGSQDIEKRGGIIAFSFDNIHPHDIAHLLGEQDICVRAGEHCAAPLHRRLNLTATTRVSLSIYNDENDIDTLIGGLKNISSVFNHQSPNSKIQKNSNDQ